MLLEIQYRMHPDVRAFPSSFFYQGRLTDSASVRARATPSFLQHWPFLPCVPAHVLVRFSLSSVTPNDLVSPLRRGVVGTRGGLGQRTTADSFPAQRDSTSSARPAV